MIFPFIYYPKILPFTKNDEKIIDPFIIYSMFFLSWNGKKNSI